MQKTDAQAGINAEATKVETTKTEASTMLKDAEPVKPIVEKKMIDTTEAAKKVVTDTLEKQAK